MIAKKCIAIITAACFLFSFVFAPSAQALGIGDDESLKTVLSGNVFIPPAAGKVSSAKSFGSGTVVINIQDLHCHPEVQRNISRILSSLDGRFSLDEVYVEGGYGDVDTSRLRVTDESLRKKLIETLVEQGKLTGAEYYSVTSNRPHLLKGIEDRELHKENLVRLGKLLDHKSRYERQLTALSRDLTFMQAKYMGLENRKFNQLVTSYRSGAVDTDRYYALLDHYVKRINGQPDRFKAPHTIRLENYPNLALYRELSRLSKTLNYRQVSNELKAFMVSLKERVPFRVYNELLEATGGFTRLDELYVYLAAIARDPSLDVGRFPALALFFDYTEKSQQLNPRLMIEEERQLVEEIRLGLSRDVAELEVSFLDDFFGHFQNYLLTRLSADDYDYFVQNFDRFRRLWAMYAIKDRLPELAGDLSLLEEYYKVNCERNTCFLRNMPAIGNAVPGHGESLTGKAAVAEIVGTPERRPKLVVVVTGGFHTPGIERLLEERKISYITVMPAVTKGTAFSDAAYSTFACQQASILSNSLALGLSTQFSDKAMFDLLLKTAAQDLKGTRFTEENLAALVTRIGEATGVEGTRLVFAAAKGEAIIVLTDGNTVVVSKDAAGGITLSAGERKAVSVRDASAVALTAAGDVLSVSAGLANVVEMVPAGYPVLKNLFSFAVRHGIIPGDGLIYRIASDPKLQEKVDGMPTELVAGFPESVQEMMAEHVRREGALDRAAKRSAALRVLLAVDLARDIIITSGIGLPIPVDAAGIERLKGMQNFRRLEGISRLGIIDFTVTGTSAGEEPLGRSVRSHDLVIGTLADEFCNRFGLDASREAFIGLTHDYASVPFRYWALRGPLGGLVKDANFDTKRRSVEMLRKEGFEISDDLERDLLNFDINTAEPVSDEARVAIAVETVEGVIGDVLFFLKNGVITPGDIPESVRSLLKLDDLTLGQMMDMEQNGIEPAVLDRVRLILGEGKNAAEIFAKAKSVREIARRDLIDRKIFPFINHPSGLAEINAAMTPLIRELEREIVAKNATGTARAIIAGQVIDRLMAMTEREILEAYREKNTPEDDLIRLASSHDKARIELDADVIIICGNDDLRTLEEAVAVYGDGKARNIMATGGVGRLTVPLLRAAFNRGIRAIELVPGSAEKTLTLDQKTLAQWRALIESGMTEDAIGLMNSLRTRGVSEALITKAILLDIARERGINLPPQAILAETGSTNTPENFTKARSLLRQLRNGLGRPVRVAYIQKPLQQLRTKATFNAAFANGIDSPGDIEGISYTFDVSRADADFYAPGGIAVDPVLLAVAEFWRLILYSAVGDVTLDPRLGLKAISEEDWSKVVAVMQAFPDKAALRNTLLRLADAPGVKPRLGGREALELALEEKGQLTAGVGSVIAWVYGEKGVPGGQERAAQAAPAEGSTEEFLAYPLEGEATRFVTWLDKVLFQTDRVLSEEELSVEAEKLGIHRIAAEGFIERAKIMAAYSLAFVNSLPRDNAYDVFLLRDSFALYAAARLTGRNARAMYLSKTIFEGLLQHLLSNGVLPYLFLDIRKKMGVGKNKVLSSAQFEEFKRLLRETLGEELAARGPEHSLPGMREKLRAAVPLILAYLDHLEMPGYETRGVRFIDTTKTGTFVLFMETLLKLPLRELGLSDKDFEGSSDSRLFYSDLSESLGYPGATLEDARLLEVGNYPVMFNARTSHIDPVTGEPSMTEIPQDKATFLFLMVALRNELLRRKGAAAAPVPGPAGKAGADLSTKPGYSISQAILRLFDWKPEKDLSGEAPATTSVKSPYSGLSSGASPASISAPKIEFLQGDRILEQLGSQVPLSFKQGLDGAEVLVIGPGRKSREVADFIELYPGIKTIHVVDVNEDVLAEVRSGLAAKGLTGPQIQYYKADARDLPAELTGKMDLVFAGAVFDASYFTLLQQRESARSIDRVLKNNGVFVSAVFHLTPKAFDGTGMQAIPIDSFMFLTAVKVPALAGEAEQRQISQTTGEPAYKLIDKAVVRECSAVGLVPVDLDAVPDKEFNEKVAQALRNGNVVALTISDSGLSYFDINKFFSSLSRSLADKFGPEMGEMDVEFSAKEILKNAFVHGNLLDRTRPIYLQVDVRTQSIRVCNVVREGRASIEELEKANDANLFNQGAAVGIMKRGRKGGTYDDRRVDVPGLPGTKIFIARTVSLSSLNPGSPLTLASSYVIARAVFRFFGWRPAKGLSKDKDALAAFEARQNRVAEYTLVPFLLVWDIVAHTFQLFIGKGGLNKYRGGGAAVIWTVTAAAALAAGLAFQAGGWGIFLAAYLANAVTHALYNLFFGSSTKASSPLSIGVPDGGIAPTYWGTGSVVEQMAGSGILNRLSSQATLSFPKDLSGAELLIIGPGKGSAEIEKFLELYPGIKMIHVVDIGDDVLKWVQTEIDEKGLAARVRCYRADAQYLPEQLTGKIDLVYAGRVFDEYYFTPSHLEQVARSVDRMLKRNGAFITATYHLDEEAFRGTGMQTIPLRSADFHAHVKTGEPEQGKSSQTEDELIDETVARVCGAPGIVPVGITDHPSDSFTANTPQFEAIYKGLKDGNVVALSLSENKRSYQYIHSLFVSLGLYLRDQLDPGLKTMNVSFLVREMLMNAFVHGHQLDQTLPIYLQVDLNKKVVRVCNVIAQGDAIVPLEEWQAAYDAELYGEQSGVQMMRMMSDYSDYTISVPEMPETRIFVAEAKANYRGARPQALTLPSSYVVARAIFRFFGWKPKAGLSDDALEAFAARQDRVAEFTLVPFLLVWDIVAHTFQLFIGKGGLNKYRGGGAAAIWTVTAAAALAAGLAFHAGIFGILVSAYLANAVTHALYNLFFGSTTKANSSLLINPFSPHIPPLGRGVSPTGSGESFFIKVLPELGVLDQLASQTPLSFRNDLAGAEVLIVGPGYSSAEIEQFIKQYPDIKTIHVVDIYEDVLAQVRADLEKKGLHGPQIQYYKSDARNLPAELTDKIDLVYANSVFDTMYFSSPHQREAAQSIARVLRPKGAFISTTHHLDDEAFDNVDMRAVPLDLYGYQFKVKAAAPSAAKSGQPRDAVGERMKSLVLRMDSFNSGRKAAYEEMFRLIEAEVLGMSNEDQIRLFNEILDHAGGYGNDASHNFQVFLEQASKWTAQFDQQHRLTAIVLSPDGMYWTFLRGMSLMELKSIVESGELVNIPNYGTFAAAAAGESSQSYTGTSAGEGFIDNREILVSLKVPMWLMTPANYDFGLASFEENREEIYQRHRSFLEKNFKEARAFVVENRAAYEERFDRYAAELQQARGKRMMSKGERARFFGARENKVYMDAERDAKSLFNLLMRWSNKDSELATLDAGYIDWETTYDQNKVRFSSEPERWARDIEPPLTAARQSHPSRARAALRTGANAGEGAALTLKSSYAISRAIFRFFGWRPAKGLSGDALAAFEARQNRFAEYTLVPFLLVWDIVAHTFQLFIGKGGLNKYRGGGAAVIWTVTAAAALAAGLAFQTGGWGIFLAAYLANAITHSLYNLFFGSTTRAGSPLSSEWGDLFRQLGISSGLDFLKAGPNASPISLGQSYAQEIDDMFRDVMPLTRQHQPSFAPDLDGADIMIIGPGKSIAEIREFITACPNIKRIRIVDRDQATLDILKAKLMQDERIKELPVEILYYHCNVADGLPDDLAEKVDLVSACKVFDSAFFFDPASNRRIAGTIRRVLKPGGMYFSSMYHLPDDNFTGSNSMTKLSLPRKTTLIGTDWIEARMKTAPVESDLSLSTVNGTGTTAAAEKGPIVVPSKPSAPLAVKKTGDIAPVTVQQRLEETVVSKVGATGATRVSIADQPPSEKPYREMTPEEQSEYRELEMLDPQFETIYQALLSGNVVVLSLAGSRRSYEDIRRFFFELLPRYFETRPIPGMEEMDLSVMGMMLGNAFVRGNALDLNQPIYLHMDGETRSVHVARVVREVAADRGKLEAAKAAGLDGKDMSPQDILQGETSKTIKNFYVSYSMISSRQVVATISYATLEGFPLVPQGISSSALTLPGSRVLSNFLKKIGIRFKPLIWAAMVIEERFIAPFTELAEFVALLDLKLTDETAYTKAAADFIKRHGYESGSKQATVSGEKLDEILDIVALHVWDGHGVTSRIVKASLVIEHMLHNFRSGTGTKADSPLSTDTFDPVHPPLSQGIAPLVTPFDRYIDRIGEYCDRIASRRALSFTKDLSGAEVLIIGPGSGTEEVEKFLKLYPGIKTLHVVDVNAANVAEVRAELERKGLAAPEIHFYTADVRDLPAELTGKIDLVYASAIFDSDYFTSQHMKEGVQSIARVLKGNGALITAIFHPETDAFAGTDLELFPRKYSELQAAVKAPDPSVKATSAAARTAGERDDTLVEETVVRECGAAGLVHVDFNSRSWFENMPTDTVDNVTRKWNDVDKVFGIYQALRDGNVIAFSFSNSGFSYSDISNCFMTLAAYLSVKFKDDTGGMAVIYLIREMMKNAFVHGNQLDLTRPIYLHVDVRTGSIRVCNIAREGTASSQELWEARKADLYGQGRSVEVMRSGKTLSHYDSRTETVPGSPETKIFIAHAYPRFDESPLTLKSSYDLSRAVFRFFGWKPAKGLSDDALTAFVARQDRVAELTLVPFLLVWDIVAHTFRLFIGRGGLNKYRGSGAAVIWTATAAAALTAGLTFHAGGWGIFLAAYLANAVSHALYNLFFGSDSSTKADSPLAMDDDTYVPFVPKRAGLLDRWNAMEQLQSMAEAMNAGRTEQGMGHQDGAILDLRALPADKEIILIGDLHTRLDNLKAILGTNDNLGRIMRGEAALVILGDAVHSETDLDEMDSSIEIMQYIMALKIQTAANGYNNVHYVLGNHDYSDPRRDFVKGPMYDKRMKQLYGDKYVLRYWDFLAASPIVVVGNGFAAAHGGPVKGLRDYDDIRDVDVSNKDNPIVVNAVWGRPLQLSGLSYGAGDVSRYLEIMGLPPDTPFIVGHSHRHGDEWHQKMLSNLHVIYAASDKAGYASVSNGGVRFVDSAPSNSSLPRAVLTENMPLVERWVSEGRSPLYIVVRVALKEFFAKFDPRFIARHDDKRGAVKVVLSGVMSALTIGLTLGMLGIVPLSAAVIGFVAGSVGMTATQIAVDNRYVASLAQQQAMKGIDPGIITQVKAQYGLEDGIGIKVLPGGMSGKKPLLITSRKGQFVLKYTGNDIDTVRYVISLRDQLREKGIPAPETMKRLTVNDNEDPRFLRIGDQYYVLEQYMEQGSMVEKWDAGIHHYRAMGKLAAEIQNAQEGVVLEGARHLPARESIVKDLREKMAGKRKLLAQSGVSLSAADRVFLDHYDFFMKQFDAYERNYNDDIRAHLRMSPIHNDLQLGNVKFNEQGEITAVFDFNNAQEGPRVYELSFGLMFSVVRWKLYGTNGFDIFQNVLGAYQEAVHVKLSPEEVRATIEVIRSDFLWYMTNIFASENASWSLSKYPEKLPDALASLDVFKGFADDMDRDGDALVQSLTGQATAARAILPKNRDWVARGIMSGLSPLSIAFRVTVREFLASVFTSRSFIWGHPDDAGRQGARSVVKATWLGAGIGLALGMAACFLGASLALLSAGAVTGLVIGNVVTHVYIDWHYVKASGLIEAVKEFGAATIDEKGQVRTNIYFMDSMPANPAEWGLRNTGLNLNGKPVWASTKLAALVLFAETKDPEQVLQALGAAATGKGQVAGNARLVARLKDFFSTLKVKTGNASFTPSVTIDHTAPARPISYNADGTMTVGAGFFRNESGSFEKSVISARLGELSTIRNAEAVATAQNVGFFLDDVTTIGQFEKRLEDFNRVGNGQMVVNASVFDGISDQKLKELADFARMSGVRIFVKTATESTQARFDRLGFAGYATIEGHSVTLVGFAMNDAISGETIEGYSNGPGLRDMIRRSKAPFKLFYLSEVSRLLNEGQCPIIDRVDILEVFKTNILGLFDAGALDAGFVTRVALAWDRKKLPVIAEHEVERLVRATADEPGTAEDIIAVFGAANLPQAVAAYLSKLANDAGGDREKVRVLQKAFLRTLVERMLAKAKLDLRENMDDGLADEGLELLLGQKLFIQAQFGSGTRYLLIDPKGIIGRAKRENWTAEQTYTELARTVKGLRNDVRPAAVNSVIELIAQIGEAKTGKYQQKTPVLFNEKSMQALLQAA